MCSSCVMLNAQRFTSCLCKMHMSLQTKLLRCSAARSACSQRAIEALKSRTDYLTTVSVVRSMCKGESATLARAR